MKAQTLLTSLAMILSLDAVQATRHADPPKERTFDFIYGDADLSGTLSAFDATLVLQHTAGIIRIDDPQIEWSDVSGNGTITAYDAALILQYVADIIDCFPADPACSD